ncbi:hypothetical protein ABTE37_20500, partial [Acinetobacter baumannii]
RIAEGADGLRLDRALADALPHLSRERLKALMAEGAVSEVSGAPARDPARRAVAGQVFTVALPPARPLEAAAEDIALTIV